jgi:hypothetical protein
MKRLVDLGKFSASGKTFAANLDLILSSNLLAQANSGGGKSWLLRRMIEQTFGRIPQIVIDPEGEFSTLRGKFDLILVGKEGDTPADVRSAQLLAHRLLELGVSAVIDLFEMSPLTRPLWVATFLQALVDAPKRLWRELLVYVDEAHMLAPEPGHGAVDSEAHRRCRGSMIEMASRGRKRGYGLVAATQRLGKLSKDFAAELKNVLIGQTFIDIDRERASGSLGIAKADRREFDHNVKNLPPGQFFAMGRALVLEPTLVQIGDVQTEHPEAGRRQSAPPPPTDKIRHLLPQLADLPKEAEQKIATEKELRAEIAHLQRELAAQPVAGPAQEKRVEVPVVPRDWLDAVRFDAAEVARLRKDLIDQTDQHLERVEHLLVKLVEKGVQYKPDQTPPRPPTTRNVIVLHKNSVSRTDVQNDEAALGLGPRKILTACAQHPDGCTRQQLTTLTGYKRRTRDAYVQRLQAAGYIECAERLVATEAGVAWLGPDFQPLPTGAALLEHWLRELPLGERACLQVAVESYPNPVTRESISDSTGYKRRTRDAYLQRLASRRLTQEAGHGHVRAASELFDGER